MTDIARTRISGTIVVVGVGMFFLSMAVQAARAAVRGKSGPPPAAR